MGALVDYSEFVMYSLCFYLRFAVEKHLVLNLFTNFVLKSKIKNIKMYRNITTPHTVYVCMRQNMNTYIYNSSDTAFKYCLTVYTYYECREGNVEIPGTPKMEVT